MDKGWYPIFPTAEEGDWWSILHRITAQIFCSIQCGQRVLSIRLCISSAIQYIGYYYAIVVVGEFLIDWNNQELLTTLSRTVFFFTDPPLIICEAIHKVGINYEYEYEYKYENESTMFSTTSTTIISRFVIIPEAMQMLLYFFRDARMLFCVLFCPSDRKPAIQEWGVYIICYSYQLDGSVRYACARSRPRAAVVALLYPQNQNHKGRPRTKFIHSPCYYGRMQWLDVLLFLCLGRIYSFIRHFTHTHRLHRSWIARKQMNEWMNEWILPKNKRKSATN